MDEKQKYFLDLTGLTKLWSKIKATFADKEETNASIGNINSSIGQINTDIQSINTDIQLINTEIENIENNVNAITPQEVDYYYDADDSNPGYIVYNNDDVDKTTIAADFLNKLEKHGYKVRKQYDEKHPNWLLVTRK